MKAGTAARPVIGTAAPDLIYHVDAISRALKNWNDLEALKLLRLHWHEIANALRELDSRKGASITVPPRDAPLQPDQRTSRPADHADHEEDGLTAEQRRFGPKVSTLSRV